MNVKRRYADLMEFNKNWDNYTIEERERILKDFQEEFNPTPIISI